MGTDGVTCISLNGDAWRIKNSEKGIDVPGEVPGYVLDALRRSGKIEDPLYRKNEEECRWIADEGWEYERDFELSKDVLSGSENVDLILTGIDTTATIHINQKEVKTVQNAHRMYRIPVKDFLQIGVNTLSIDFESALKVSRKNAKKYPYPVPSMQSVGMFPHYNFIRKSACDFGWDWGPAFAQCGIFGSIELHAYSIPYLTGLHVCQDHDPGTDCILHVQFKVQGVNQDFPHGEISFKIPELEIEQKMDASVVGPVLHTFRMKVVLDVPFEKWWPHDMGSQKLYTVEATFNPESVDKFTSKRNPSSIDKKIGMRKIELVREPLESGSQGESFYFKVNGQRIFAKGANLIPTDINHSKRIDRKLIQDVKSANMNMLRVWGGGLYADESFYEACDQLGILVWQEAMFACCMYPRDDAFLEEVSEEIEYQAFRLGSHACIAIWGGNNEIEACKAWYRDTRENPFVYIVDMDVLFVQTIYKALRKVDPYVPYVDSSPSNGLLSTVPYVKRYGEPGNPQYGDVHYYNYKDDALDYSHYPAAKFVSEFGFQSFPSFTVYKTVSIEEDWSYVSDLSDYRQRHRWGNEELLSHMRRHFDVPYASDPDPKIQTELFRQWIYLTQLHQALCYQTAIAYWRSLKNNPDALTSGVLYWQLNDIWQAPTWSGINHGGKWKLLHYMAKRFYAPFMVSGRLNTKLDIVEFFATSDVNEELFVEMDIELIAWDARKRDKPIRVLHYEFALEPNHSKGVTSLIMEELIPTSLVYTQHTCFLHIKGKATNMPPASGFPQDQYQASTKTWESEYTLPLVPIKEVILLEPRIEVEEVEVVDSPNVVTFKLRSEVVVPYVGLEADVTGEFDDNVFTMLPWEVKEMVFNGGEDFDLDKFVESLDIRTPFLSSVDESWVAV